MNTPSPNPWLDALPKPLPVPGPHRAEPDSLFLHLGEAWYPPAPAVQARLTSIFCDLPRYPDALSHQLRETLAGYCGHGITPENIVVGNGSDGLIDLLACAFAGPTRPIVAPAPTFFAYGNAAITRRVPLVTAGRLSQNDGFVLDADKLTANLPPDPGIIFLANPNNPTGEIVSAEVIARIAESTSALVVVDECYYEFAGQTALALLTEHPNIVILRSLSKSFALAGLRVGYAVGHRDIIEAVMRVDQTFSVNAAAQKCADAALRSLDYYQPLFAETGRLRGEWQRSLANLGFKVFPSRANILLVDYTGLTTINVAQALKDRGIYVADFHARAGIRNAFRLAVAGPEALQRFAGTVTEMIAG